MEQGRPTSPRSPGRGDSPAARRTQEAHTPCLLPQSDQTETQSSRELPPNVPPPPPAPTSPTSAPTGPPTSCHCLGLNPSSAPAAWRALPGRGAVRPQGRPLMPRRVRGPGLGAGLGPRASTARACLSASCPLQKPGELIKNRWAGRGGSGCRPGPQPQLCRPSPQLQAASSPGPPAPPMRRCWLSLPPPPRDQVTAIDATSSTCPSNAPVGGWGGPAPWPRLVNRWQKSGMFPPQSQPLICFKGPAPHLACLVARWGGIPNSP